MRKKIFFALLLISIGSLINAQEFSDPVLLKTGNKPIDINSGYCAPCLFDYNKDGKPDLILGTLFGTFIYYQNTGTKENPSYLEKGFLKDGNANLRANNW